MSNFVREPPKIDIYLCNKDDITYYNLSNTTKLCDFVRWQRHLVLSSLISKPSHWEAQYVAYWLSIIRSILVYCYIVYCLLVIGRRGRSIWLLAFVSIVLAFLFCFFFLSADKRGILLAIGYFISLLAG